MKKLIALLLATLSINAAAVEYRAATTEHGETIVFSNLDCPFGKNLSVARVIAGTADVYVCYGVLEDVIVLIFEDGDTVKIDKSELHLLPRQDI